MSESEAGQAYELSQCDLEPIHISGAVQPHGVLMVVSEPDLRILQVSANTQAVLGTPTADMLDSLLSRWLDPDSLSVLTEALALPRVQAGNPLKLVVAGRALDGICHRHHGLTFLELEPSAGENVDLSGQLRAALEGMQACSTIAGLHQLAAEEVRRLTGFDRVMVYRFDSAGHGSVVAEARDPSVSPYLGLRYPASDIPRQARALYLLNWLRIIPDARYQRAPIVPATRAASSTPLDLSHAVLRSVSPIHLEYMRNMGATASMSISLVVRGQLWGLISCVHHSGTRFVGYGDRAACEVIGRLVSLQTEALEELQRRVFRESLRAPLDLLEATMRKTPGPVFGALSEQSAVLLSLVGATGAVISHEDSLDVHGLQPSAEQLAGLLRWLDLAPAQSVFSTACLSDLYPAARDWKEAVSGLLCISLPGSSARRVLWFRPELAQTIRWSGDPQKVPGVDPSTGLHPRRSFELWKEELSRTSLPWTSGEIDAAVELRRRAIEIDLVRQVERGEQAVRARDDLVAVVSHDLKTPLSVIQMQSSLLLRGLSTTDGESSRRMRAASERIQRAIDRMNTLIHDLLDLSKIEAGRFEVHATWHDARAMVEEALLVLEPLGHPRGIALVLVPGENCAAVADRDRIYQVISNLVGNALKFSPDDSAIQLRVVPERDEVLFTVTDRGPGIEAEQLPHLFNRYWQAPRSGRKGSGLGLYIAKGIVEAHGGRIWADSKLGAGSSFSFVLPGAPGSAEPCEVVG
ncbi:MAG: multi-sensor signal transduction histidine kinase [Myxococcaceae bacterium]|nr:multi-sensor signal transduction histidine kinase [Myxococcaceae bacterium]